VRSNSSNSKQKLSLIRSLANNSKFVDRGLKYIDEVTLVSEAAKSFPSIFVPWVKVPKYLLISRLKVTQESSPGLFGVAI
jgi:hypothetical protein